MEKRSKIIFDVVEDETGKIDVINPNIGANGTNALNMGFAMGLIGSIIEYTKTWRENNPDINAVSEK